MLQGSGRSGFRAWCKDESITVEFIAVLGVGVPCVGVLRRRRIPTCREGAGQRMPGWRGEFARICLGARDTRFANWLSAAVNGFRSGVKERDWHGGCLVGLGMVAALKFCRELPTEQTWTPEVWWEESAMAVTGILSSALFGLSAPSAQSTAQKLKQEFQQLGQDLASGNLSAAKSDFATLQQDRPQGSATSSGSATAASTAAAGQSGNSTNPITQAFQQLSQDLQSGNLSAAQSDYSTLQQDFKSQAGQGQQGHHHRRVGESGGSGAQTNPISTLFSQLGQALQAGNLTAAQTAYSTLQSDFAQFAQSNGLSTGTSTSSGSSGISVSA